MLLSLLSWLSSSLSLLLLLLLLLLLFFGVGIADWCRDRFGITFGLLLIGVGSFWVRFGFTLGSYWDRFGVILGLLRGQFGIIVGLLWGHFEIALGSLWKLGVRPRLGLWVGFGLGLNKG